MADVIAQLEQAVRNLDTRLRAIANAQTTLQTWQAPVLVNSWANVGGAYQVAGYWKDTNGLVHLRGRLSGGAFPSTIFTLPANYKPEATSSFTAPSGAVVDVLADGSVVAASGSSYVSLDGVTLRAYS